MGAETDPVLVYILFFGVPGLSVVWFIVSLILYLTAKKNTQRKSDFQAMAIISGILAFLLAGLIGGLLIAAAFAVQ